MLWLFALFVIVILVLMLRHMRWHDRVLRELLEFARRRSEASAVDRWDPNNDKK